MQTRFDKHLGSHIFGQAPFVSEQASPPEVFLKGTAFHSQQGTIPASVSLSYNMLECSSLQSHL